MQDFARENRQELIRKNTKVKTSWWSLSILIAVCIILGVHVWFQFQIVDVEIKTCRMYSLLEYSNKIKYEIQHGSNLSDYKIIK